MCYGMEQNSKPCFACFKLNSQMDVRPGGQVSITEQLHVKNTKHIHNSLVHCNPIVRHVLYSK